MGAYRAEVFIASRFEEFRELRAELCRQIGQHRLLSPIDMNDGHARSNPPLSDCLASVRRSEFMVLLVGSTYGDAAPGHQKSFTQLEYEQAIREDSKTCVLVYVAGSARPASNGASLFDRWCRELEANHTLGFLEPGTGTADHASRIVSNLVSQLYELGLGSVAAEEDEASELAPESMVDDGFDEEELDALDSDVARARGMWLDGSQDQTSSVEFALRHPAAVASLEQRAEAQRAIALREPGIAIQHLTKALALRPLDYVASFWLARLYLATMRRKHFGDAVALAERAARLANEEQRPFYAAACYLLASRTAGQMGDFSVAHGYVDAAQACAKTFAKTYLERARLFCQQKLSRDAVAAVRQAFRIRMNSLQDALRDPHLKSIHSQLRELRREMAEHWVREVEQLASVEQELATLTGETAVLITASPNHSLQMVAAAGRESVLRQLGMVRIAVGRGEAAYRDLQIETPPKAQPSAAAHLASERLRLKREWDAARVQESSAAAEREQASSLPPLLPLRVILWALSAALSAAALAALGAGIFSLVSGVAMLAWSGREASRGRLALDGAKRKLNACTEGHAAARAHRERIELLLEDATARRAQLQLHCEAVMSAAKQALELFESKSLQMEGRYQPFAGVGKVRPGRLVRVSAKTVDELERSGELRIDGGGSFWADHARPAEYALYRAMDENRGQLTLSRAKAYLFFDGDALPAPSSEERFAPPPANAMAVVAHTVN